MVKFIDERRCLDELLKNPKTIKKDTMNKLIIYIKYLKELKKTKAQVRDELDAFMYKYYDGFVMADWDDRLQKATNKYTKPKFREFLCGKNVNITYKELMFIKEKQDIEIEKLLFILLVLAKASMSENTKELWLSCDSTYIFKLSKFKYSSMNSRFNQRELKINDLATKGLLMAKAVIDSDDIKLLYGSVKKGEGLDLILDDITSDSIIYHYMKWRGDETIKECQECGILIQKTSTKDKKYCDKCAKKVNIKKTSNNRK